MTGPLGRYHRVAMARRVDPLLVAVGGVGLVVYVLHGFDQALTRDPGVYAYGGQRLLEGDPPYVGILNRAGPLAHALPALGIGLGRQVGLSDVHGVRVFFMLIAVACLCLTYLLVRDLTGSRAAGLVAASAFLMFEGFVSLSTNGPREKAAMVMFLLAAMLAMLHRRWATCGVFVALATLTWQPVFFVAALTVVVAVLLAPDRRPAALLRVAVGGAVPTALVVLYYAANGAVHTFLEGFVLINAQYTVQPSPFAHLGVVWDGLRDGFGASLWVIAIGLAVVPVLAVASFGAARRTHEAEAASWVAIGVGWLAGLGWCAIAFNAWMDLLVVLPFAAIGVGGGAAWVLGRLDRRAAVATTVALALAATAYATVFSVTTRDDALLTQQASIRAVLRTGPHPATILSVQAPEVLVLTHRTNPTPYQMFDHGFPDYLDATYPGGLPGFVGSIQRTAPTYIVTQPTFRTPWLTPWLKQHYVDVGGTPEFTWWVSKSVRPQVRHEIRAAQAAAAPDARS